MDFTPVAGDTAGNNLKWDSMKIEADMYLKTGNYSLLRDVRMRQARFTELEGNERIAISYYCMAFYADLNGFENLDRLIAARDSSFSDWKCTAHVDVGIVNKIFYLCSTYIPVSHLHNQRVSGTLVTRKERTNRRNQ